MGWRLESRCWSNVLASGKSLIADNPAPHHRATDELAVDERLFDQPSLYSTRTDLDGPLLNPKESHLSMLHNMFHWCTAEAS